MFLYQQVLGCELGWLDEMVRAKRPRRLPTILTRHEVQLLLNQLDGIAWMATMLLYGSGLRVLECLRLRVKDIDFERRELLVREGKGDKDRVTIPPAGVVTRLQATPTFSTVVAAVYTARPTVLRCPKRRRHRRCINRLTLLTSDFYKSQQTPKEEEIDDEQGRFSQNLQRGTGSVVGRFFQGL